jgi:GR25 family glycosyltransferase involved in LPS biosynthesis
MNPESAARPRTDASSPAFHAVERRGDCPFCTGASEPADLSPSIDATYCISLREEPWRAEKVSDLFHDVGLCRSVRFYRPTRGVEFSGAVWASHREIARHALAHGVERALIFEDDVSLPRNWPAQRARIFRALEKLPGDWMGFFLGHRPVQGHFVRRDILRVRSMYTHAYVANRPLLQWLAETEPMDPRVPVRGPNIAIDSAFANLPGMYALFPLIATQRFMGEYRFDTARTDTGARRRLLDPARYQYLTKYHGLRPAEILAVLASPFHRFTLERFRKRSGVRRSEDASLIHDSGLLDDAYYRQTYPGVASSGMSSIMHYVWFGARELRNPHPLFDTAFYLGQKPRLRHRDENPLAHYLRTGAREGLDPHPSFSTSAYLASHPELEASGVNPLVHSLRGRSGG